MSMDLSALVDGQSEIHTRIARSVDNLRKMGMNNITVCAVETRIRMLDEQWAKFETQHDLIRAAYKEKYRESEYAQSDILEITENTYVQNRSAMSEYLNSLKPAVVPSKAEQGDRAPKTSLPRIHLPKFSGAYEDWPSFRDLFCSVVGNNPAVSDVEKLHYLRSCLQGPAEKLTRSLNLTHENYTRAWAMLDQHYENKKELIRSNFVTFTTVAKMKGETAEELSRIHDAMTAAVNAQESIGRPINSHGMDLFNHLVVELFDPRTRLVWESATSESRDPANHDTLTNFMAQRILTLNAAKPKPTGNGAGNPSRTAKTHFTKHGSSTYSGPMCKGTHTLMYCDEFKLKSASERKSIVESNRLCYNCLGRHPVGKCQSKRNCLTCKARHHSMLHEAYASPQTTEASTLSAQSQHTDVKAILLATARVTVSDRYGEPHAVRILLDQGSEVSLISKALAQRLRLPRSRSSMSILGVGDAQTGSTRGKVTLSLTSKTTGANFTAVAFVLPRLSSYRGTSHKGSFNWPHLQGLALADPQFLDNDPIEMLLGAEVYSVILEDGICRGNPQAPLAQKTILGWILSGGCGAASLHGHRSSLQCTAEHDLLQLVHRFWEQERETSAPTVLTPDEEKCENLFVRSHQRTADGRYVVRLPFSSTPTTLADTRKSAEGLLTAMERKCRLDTKFGNLYRSFMSEYENLQHMELLNASSDGEIARCYLPHHGVIRESSTTTKLRVVFNGSQRSRSGDSLNSHLLVGANLLPALSDVLLRWRWHRFVLISDVEKMYRQIVVHPDDRDFQRVLWRPSVFGDVREYRLNTVTYGLACAPFLAIRTLRQLADDEEPRYPRGAAALRRDCYVDDVVTGAETLNDAIALQRDLRELCTAGGFPLRKWAANCEDILAGIPPEHRLQKPTRSW